MQQIVNCKALLLDVTLNAALSWSSKLTKCLCRGIWIFCLFLITQFQFNLSLGESITSCSKGFSTLSPYGFVYNSGSCYDYNLNSAGWKQTGTKLFSFIFLSNGLELDINHQYSYIIDKRLIFIEFLQVVQNGIYFFMAFFSKPHNYTNLKGKKQ